MRSYFTFCTLLFLICSSIYVNAQFVLLKEIGNFTFGGTDNTINGLPYEMNGRLNPDNTKLFFSGTTDGESYNVWETNGTIEGTKKISITPYINNIHFLDKGIFLHKEVDEDKLYYMNWNSSNATNLPFFYDKNIGKPYGVGNKYIIVSDASPNIFITDGTNNGSREIYTFSSTNINSKYVSTGNSIATVFHKSGSPKFKPIIYDSANDTLLLVKEYIKDIIVADDVTYTYCFDDILIVSAVKNNFPDYYIIDVKKRISKPIDLGGVFTKAFQLSNGNYLMLTSTDLWYIDKNSLETTLLNDKVHLFIPYSFENDKLVFGVDSPNAPSFYESDGTISGTKPLPGTNVGANFFESSCLLANNKLYYVKQSTSENYSLMVYDMASQQIDSIGTVRENLSSSITTDHGLFNINGKIIVSRYTEESGHELYAIGTTATSDLTFATVTLYPSTSTDIIHLKSDIAIESVKIIDPSGKNIFIDIDGDPLHKQLNINGLLQGNYFVQVLLKNGHQISKPFSKM